MYAVPQPKRAVRPSPLFALFVAVAVGGGILSWTSDNPTGQVTTSARFGVFCMVLGGWVVTLCLHEFAHAYAAYRGGDRSVEAAGYLTLNPFKYAHPLLSIVLPLVFIAQGGIGLPGGAVYLHRHSLRSRGAQSLSAAVGPAVNLVFGVILLQLAHSHDASVTGLGLLLPEHGAFWSGLAFLGFLQISAAVLNLLPIPGLDGYAIIEPYLDPATARPLEQIKPYGMLGVFVLLQLHSINTAFFDGVGRIYTDLGGPQFARDAGYDLFRFWTKN